MTNITHCLMCNHSKLRQQFGQVNRVCEEGPPTALVIPGGAAGTVEIRSYYPVVDEGMRCDRFELSPEPSDKPKLIT